MHLCTVGVSPALQATQSKEKFLVMRGTAEFFFWLSNEVVFPATLVCKLWRLLELHKRQILICSLLFDTAIEQSAMACTPLSQIEHL